MITMLVLVHDPELVWRPRGLTDESDLGRPRGSRGCAPGEVLDAGNSASSGGSSLAPRRERRNAGTTLLLAESAYQRRFRTLHPVVANSVSVPKVVDSSGR